MGTYSFSCASMATKSFSSVILIVIFPESLFCTIIGDTVNFTPSTVVIDGMSKSNFSVSPIVPFKKLNDVSVVS